MLDIPLEPRCPNCGTEGVENLNMIIKIMTEQPLKYFKKLPGKISLSPRTSHNGAWVDWDSDRNNIICRKCGYSCRDSSKFEGYKEH